MVVIIMEIHPRPAEHETERGKAGRWFMGLILLFSFILIGCTSPGQPNNGNQINAPNPPAIPPANSDRVVLTGADYVEAAVIDPRGELAYIAMRLNKRGKFDAPNGLQFTTLIPTDVEIIKLRLHDLSVIGRLSVGRGAIKQILLDSKGEFAYLFSVHWTNRYSLVKIRTTDLVAVSNLTFSYGDNISQALMDANKNNIYLVGEFSDAHLIEVRLSDLTITSKQEISDLTITSKQEINWEDYAFVSSSFDSTGQYALFGTYPRHVRNETSDELLKLPALVINVSLEKGQIENVLPLEPEKDENFPEVPSWDLPIPGSILISPFGDYAYVSTDQNTIIKIDLNQFKPVSLLKIDSSAQREFLDGPSLMDSQGRFAYFGTDENEGRIIKIRLSDFVIVDWIPVGKYLDDSAIIEPTEQTGYFFARTDKNVELIKVQLN